MAVEIEEFYKDFFQEVVSVADTGSFMESAFTEVYCNYLVDAGEFDTFDATYYKADRGMRVDGYAGDPSESDDILTLIVSDFSDEEEPPSLTKSQLAPLFKRLENFYRASLREDFYIRMEETSRGYGLAQMINARHKGLARVRFYLVTNRMLSSRVDAMDVHEIDGIPVTYNVWDLSRLHRMVSSRKGKEDIEIDLIGQFGEALPVLPAHLGNAEYKSYLAVVPGRMLADLYEKWGARLLEQNVRCFLQARGKVNKGMRGTILNDPGMFFAYNNGITATAEAVETTVSDGQVAVTGLKNFQIVNGGQTTASIFTARKKDKAELEKLFVQMKLSVVEPEMTETVVPKISEYANSQNKVNAADFFANHPFHVRIEEFSRRIWAKSPEGTFRETKWFYERARGQYLDAKALLSARDKKQFEGEYPKPQCFTKTDLAKFEFVWEGMPHIVSMGAQKNFAAYAKEIGSRWEKDSDQFNERYFHHIVAKALIFRSLEKLVTKQSWYDGGYRANVVAYTLAKLADMIGKRRKVLDFDTVWEKQCLSSELESQLLVIAAEVNKLILDPPAGIRNVSEYAKKISCWEAVKSHAMDLEPGFSGCMVSLGESGEKKKEAKKIQKIDNGIEAQTRVFELGQAFWRSCAQWARENKVLTPSDHQLLAIAENIPSKIPNEKQSILLTEILTKLEEEACPHLFNL